MTNPPRDNARFRAIDDGTVLYRRNRSTRTYVITSEQRDQISKLHGQEIAAAFLLAPPILAFVITSLEGNFGLVWQITGVYTLLYCAFNFAFSRKISSKIDGICQSAQTTSPEQEIVFPSIWNGFRRITGKMSAPVKLGFYLFSVLYTAVSFVIICSAVLDISFLRSLDLHWAARLLIGSGGVLMFGMPIVAAVHDILEKRDSKKNVRADPFR